MPGIAGLREGIRYISDTGASDIQWHEWRLTRRLLEGLSCIPRVKLYGPNIKTPRAPVVSFNVEGMESVAVAEELDRRKQIACRPGLHCAFLAHQTQGTEKLGTVRLSFGHSTTEAAVEEALDAIRDLVAK